MTREEILREPAQYWDWMLAIDTAVRKGVADQQPPTVGL